MFEKSLEKSYVEHTAFLDTLLLPILNESKTLLCEGALTEKELNTAMMSMAQEKAPENDGLTKEFYCCFWDELKEPFATPIRATKRKTEFIQSQKQAAIKSIQRKDRDEKFIQNWRPICLLNIDFKIADTLNCSYCNYEIGNTLNFEDYLVTIDIEEAFDWLNHSFSMAVLKKFGFGPSFLEWIEAVLKNQCVINAGTATAFLLIFLFLC